MSEAVSRETLLERIEELEQRVDALESRGSHTNDVRDPRDSAVLWRLSPGDVYRASDIITLYQHHTDIKNEETAKKRLRSLTSQGAFEFIRPGVWCYTGGDDDGA